MQAAGRPTPTVKLRCYQLRRYAEGHPVDSTTDQMIAWLAHSGWSPETKKSYRAALVGFYGWAHRRGHLDHDPTLDLPTVRTPQRVPRPAPDQVLQRAILTADPRVQLMLALAGRHGLRRSEIAQVHTRDMLGEDRIVPLDVATGITIARTPPGWVFPSPSGGHLTEGHVGKLVAAALDGHWTAHSLRHRFATAAYAGTRDLLAVQLLLGHTRPETTRGYILVPQDDLRAALQAAA